MHLPLSATAHLLSSLHSRAALSPARAPGAPASLYRLLLTKFFTINHHGKRPLGLSLSTPHLLTLTYRCTREGVVSNCCCSFFWYASLVLAGKPPQTCISLSPCIAVSSQANACASRSGLLLDVHFPSPHLSRPPVSDLLFSFATILTTLWFAYSLRLISDFCCSSSRLCMPVYESYDVITNFSRQ